MTRVFIVCTGRCGSVSFREACRYATNYRTGHESHCGFLEYPDQWIEVNNHLRCVIPHMANKYPDALWVHLIREPKGCIRSLERMNDGAHMRAYQALYPSVMPSHNLGDVAYRYYWAENDAINVQLTALVANPQRRVMRLESIKDEWADFWQWIGAEGDDQASLAAWDVRRNTTEERRRMP